MRSRRARRRAGGRRLVVIAATALAMAAGCTPTSPPPPTGPTPTGGTEPPPTRRPDIVLILTDDQRWDALDGMPTVKRLLVDEGVRFTNAFVVDPLCCPSRASILTGSYAHTTGVYANAGRHGGWSSFRRAERSTIATWLQDAGYRTGLFGKYLNGYRSTTIPPGWDRAFAFISARPSYFDYTVNDDGVAREYGSAPAEYATDVIGEAAARFIRRTPSDQPLFMWVAPSAPHLPAVPAPRYEDAPVTPGPTSPPSFNESDVSDKPAYIRELGPVSAAAVDAVRERGARTLLAVDDMVGTIVQALQRSGRLDDAMVVFMSDNGRSLGEHRWNYKQAPYEETIRVPLVIRFDALGTSPRTIDGLALNIDLAPTFADLAGVDPASSTEGRSLLPLLESGGAPWRRDFLIENLRTNRHGNPEVPTYCAIRSDRYKYVRYETGEIELYDLRRDPFELDNIAGDAPARLNAHMERRLVAACDPPPPGFVP